MSTYTITAGNNTTDLGTVGTRRTLSAAIRIGRLAVRDCLPGGQGRYTVRDADGRDIVCAERSLRTEMQWHHSVRAS